MLLHIQTQRLYAGEHVALVVGDASGVEAAVPDSRLERVALPEIQGFGWLHVVVAVGEECRFARADLRVDHGVSFGLHDAGLGAGLLQLPRHPPCAVAELSALVLAGGDRRHPKELVQLPEKLFSRTVHALAQIHPSDLLCGCEEVSTFASGLRAVVPYHPAWSIRRVADILGPEVS